MSLPQIYGEVMKTSVFAFTLALLFATTASASVIPLLANGRNGLEDDDFESLLVDANSNGVIDIGDRFVGVFRVQGINNSMFPATLGVGAAGNPTVTAVFALELRANGGAASGSATQLYFGPLQGVGGNAAIAEWAGLNLGFGLDLPIPNSNNTMIVTFNHPDYGLTTPGIAGGMSAAIDTFDNDTAIALLAEFGFTTLDTTAGTDYITSAGEFFTTEGSLFGGLGVDVIATIPGRLASPSQLDDPANALNLNVTFDNLGDDVVFNPHDHVFPGILGALQGNGRFVPNASQPSGAFQLSTDTDLVVDLTIPEPMSVIVWGLMATIGGWAGRRAYVRAQA
jgi:hypothetical protein